ncbi:MAG: DUF1990 family protein [Nocardioidaceae bacterium]|nr:DUF1990 family protein [Nocardioidaceae bacterium]
MAEGQSRHSARLRDTFAQLSSRRVNYRLSPGEEPSPATGWHLDSMSTTVGRETPGPPVTGAAWEIAVQLLRDYEFAEPGILRGLFRRDSELLGRDMLLEGRFYGLRFYMGVRVVALIDETPPDGLRGRRVWGWCYDTLQGHLEQGRLTYEVVKQLDTGDVEFVISGFSRRAPIANPVIRLGFHLLGRWTQERFYRRSSQRMRALVQAGVDGAPLPVPIASPDDPTLVIAPSDSTSKLVDRAAVKSHEPGAP